MRSSTFLAPAAVLVLAVSGCGGDKGPSKADYVKQADAVCQKGNTASQKATDAAVAKLGSSPTQAQLAKVIDSTVVPGVEQQLKALRALKQPKDDADTINGIYDALQSGVDKVKADPTLATGSSTSPFADANAKAQAYGLKVCGKS